MSYPGSLGPGLVRRQGGGKGDKRKLTREEENLLGERLLKGGVQLGRQRRPRVSDREGALHLAFLVLRESPVLPGNV